MEWYHKRRGKNDKNPRAAMWLSIRQELGRCAIDVPINVDGSRMVYSVGRSDVCVVMLDSPISPHISSYLSTSIRRIDANCIVVVVVARTWFANFKRNRRRFCNRRPSANQLRCPLRAARKFSKPILFGWANSWKYQRCRVYGNSPRSCDSGRPKWSFWETQNVPDPKNISRTGGGSTFLTYLFYVWCCD